MQNVGAGLDPTTRTLLVRAVVHNESGRLRPEMFATVWIGSGEARTAVTVPEGAIQLLDGRTVVFVAQPDANGGAQFERRDIEVGTRTGGQVQIVKGLAPGDAVVIDGVAHAVVGAQAEQCLPGIPVLDASAIALRDTIEKLIKNTNFAGVRFEQFKQSLLGVLDAIAAAARVGAGFSGQRS